LKINWDKLSEKIIYKSIPNLDIFLQKEFPKNARIIDFGCGQGRIGAYLYTQGYKNVVGYDICKESIAFGKKEFPGLMLNYYDFPQIPEADESFDIAICYFVLSVVAETEGRIAVLDEIKRVLKKQGHFFCAEFFDEKEAAKRNITSAANIQKNHVTPLRTQDISLLIPPLTLENIKFVKTRNIRGREMTAVHFLCKK
jgi:ubiquinone/menaquinone biosynthesis C-methylase UbiE